MANAAEFVKHAIQYAKTVEIGPEDILVVIIPPNAGRQAKLYFVNQLFLGTTANMIRLEYRCSFELYALQQQSAVIIEKDQFYSILPVIQGFLQKEYVCYAQSEEDISRQLKNLFGTRLNFFAKKALKNAILFAYPTQQEDAIAESAELGCYTVENKEELVAEGIRVY